MVKALFGAEVTNPPDDNGVIRSATVTRFDNDATQIRLVTTWKEGATPVETVMTLSPEGLALLSEVTDFAVHELHRFPFREPEPEQGA